MKVSDIDFILGQIEALAEQVNQGNADALESHVMLSLIEKQLKDAKSKIQDAAIDQASQYTKGDEPTMLGFCVSSHDRKTAKVEYPKQLAEMQAQLKDYEKLAKLGKTGLFYASPDGEQIEVIPAQFTYSSYIKLTPAKKWKSTQQV